MRRPVITCLPIGIDLFELNVSGRFGGGYSGLRVSRQKAVAILARDARSYDCGEEPIQVVAPADIKQEAGL